MIFRNFKCKIKCSNFNNKIKTEENLGVRNNKIWASFKIPLSIILNKTLSNNKINSLKWINIKIFKINNYTIRIKILEVESNLIRILTTIVIPFKVINMVISRGEKRDLEEEVSKINSNIKIKIIKKEYLSIIKENQ